MDGDRSRSLGLILHCIFICTTTAIVLKPRHESLILPDAGPYAYRTKTFHLATLSRVQGRVNLQPWYSEQDRKSPDYDLVIVPNFETAYYDLQLLPPLQAIVSNSTDPVNCTVVYSCLGHEEKHEPCLTRLEYKAVNGNICQWPGQKLTPGVWHRFQVYRNNELLVHCWQTVKPAFDADAFKVTVQTTLEKDGVEVDIGTHQYSLLWQSFVGHGGEILVNLLGGDKMKPIRKNIPSLDQNQQYPSTKVQFRNLTPGHCYTAEVMAAAHCVLSFNRTWFNIRAPVAPISLTLKNVTSDSAVVKLITEDKGLVEQDPSCTTILTLEQKNCGTRYVFMGKRKTAIIVGLKPNASYMLGGVNQCGHLTDVCRLEKSPIEKVLLTTKSV